MPQSKKPRKQYRRVDWAAEAARNRSIVHGETGEAQAFTDADAKAFNSSWANAKLPEEPVHKPAPAPAQPHVAGPTRTPRALSRRGRYVGAGALGAAALGGGLYLAHRRRRSNMSKGLIDPLSGDVVVIEKRYIEDDIDIAKAGVPRRAALLMRAGQAGSKARGAVTAERAGLASGGVLVGAALPRRQQVGKRSGGVFVPGGMITGVSTGGRGHTWERGGTSHANDPTVIRRHRRRSQPSDAVERFGRSKRSASGSSVGKMFSENQHGTGRRLVSA